MEQSRESTEVSTNLTNSILSRSAGAILPGDTLNHRTGRASRTGNLMCQRAELKVLAGGRNMREFDVNFGGVLLRFSRPRSCEVH